MELGRLLYPFIILIAFIAMSESYYSSMELNNRCKYEKMKELTGPAYKYGYLCGQDSKGKFIIITKSHELGNIYLSKENYEKLCSHRKRRK